MRRSGLRETGGGPVTINGLEAYLGTYQGRLGDMGDVVMRAAHIRQDRTIYLVAGFAAPALYPSIEPALSTSVRSFRALSREEADGVRPNRVALYTVRAGDTWQSIAARQSGGIVPATTLAIMNDHPVDQQPASGERIKIVVAE
jgi:predicted Zn-dependent protease